MADPITFTCGGREYRLDSDPALRAALLSCPPGPETAAVRAAAGRGRLVPPTVARIRAAVAVEYLVPEVAVTFTGDGSILGGTPPGDADGLLRALAGLLDDLRAELPHWPLALAADPAAVGFVLAPGRRLYLLPGSVAPSREPDFAAAGTMARLLRGLAGSPLLGDGGEAWAWFAARLDPFADGKGSLAELAACAADALRRIGLNPLAGPSVALPACKACGARVEDEVGVCPGCGKSFRTSRGYRQLDDHWVEHPRLGRKPYLLAKLAAGARTPSAVRINDRLAKTESARVVDRQRFVGSKSGRNGAPDHVLLVFSEPPPTAVLERLRRAIAKMRAVRPVAVAAPAAVAAPPPPLPASITCASCRTAVPAGRKFCPKCGAFTSPAVPASAPPPPADDAPGTLLESAGGANRWGSTAGGRDTQVIDTPEPGACADLLAALGSAGDRPRALPAVLDTVRRGKLVRVTLDAGGNERPWIDWCRLHRADADFHDRLASLIEDLLVALAGLHAVNGFYAAALADRVRVSGDPPAARLDWPLAPRKPGAAAAGARSMLGYTPPEFGHPDRPAGADADVFALAAVVLAGLMGRDPPPSLSRDDLDLTQVRAWVPGIPAGWGGWLEKALAKRPPDRFPGPTAALAAWRDLNAPGVAPAGFVAAAALHVGVGKSKSNPKNQDRVVLVPLPGVPPARTALDGFPAEENFATAEAACPGSLFVAVADGISTVTSGELAAESVAGTLAALAAGLPADADPGPTLARLFEAANAVLGTAVAAAAPGRPKLTTAAGCPSATLAAALLAPDRAAVANLGDSRVYLLRAGVLEQLTVDGDEGTRHLLAGSDADAALDRDDAKELIGWVGRFAPAAGDARRIDPTRPVPVATGPGFSTLSFRPRAGDIFCCCSDGVSDYADGGMIDLAEVLAAYPPAEACRHLVETANAAGGGDNISVVVARALAPADSPAPPARTSP